MITRPSISELSTGLIRNLEKHAGDAGAVHQLLVPIMAVLDRLESEWHSWVALLVEDNSDIRETLKSLGITALPECTGLSGLHSRNSASVVTSLEAENRALKQALVESMAHFDLPADRDAETSRQKADRSILSLLQRLLIREDSVQVPPPRSAATGGNPANATVALDELEGILRNFLQDQMPAASSIVIKQLQPLAGGASREAWIFDVSWQEADAHLHEECILMREPVASVLVSDSAADVIDGTRRTVATEIRLVQAMEKAGFAVPAVLWFDAKGRWLERPFSIARRLPGTADAAELVGSEHLDSILSQFIDMLAQLHAVDPLEMGLDFLGRPTVLNTALAQVEQFERNFDSQRLEAFPATTYLIRWLKKNAPKADRVSVVHGDYRLGNFLFEKDRIIAILDWEQVHLGDPVEEIAFMYWSVWTMEPLCPIETFVQRYERATGRGVDRQALAYYRMFIEFKMLVVLLTGVNAYFATPEFQLHYGSAMTTEMIRDSQRRAIEALLQGGPTVGFDAYETVQLDAGVEEG